MPITNLLTKQNKAKQNKQTNKKNHFAGFFFYHMRWKMFLLEPNVHKVGRF